MHRLGAGPGPRAPRSGCLLLLRGAFNAENRFHYILTDREDSQKHNNNPPSGLLLPDFCSRGVEDRGRGWQECGLPGGGCPSITGIFIPDRSISPKAQRHRVSHSEAERLSGDSPHSQCDPARCRWQRGVHTDGWMDGRMCIWMEYSSECLCAWWARA